MSSKTVNLNGNLEVSFQLKNSGKAAGAEVAQLYISDVKSSVDRPSKELKRFAKVYLEPGETKTVKFEIDQMALSFFDAQNKVWIAEPGDFEILIGGSSEDIKLKGMFTLNK